ncbi:MAG TPA: hypothetical protein IAC95_02170 [Candidatus Fimimonas gallinarum]|uniref:Ferritin-like domain-containing protein n=1 Tax=Candidatus Fimimonas gallinarum TaxID=2840821 RepID=A0A9D1E3M8_9BACT|nr:hypothetical protein [Candidatus Fimimonas gallinarum]
MNPFVEKPIKTAEDFYGWNNMALKPYNKFDVDPYTRVRIILANGAEYEAVWFSHQFHRHERDNDLRRDLATLRRKEQQQQKRIASLKPIGEGILEHTIGYEQLAVDLTAIFAQRESDRYVKQAMDFALLEDFDHLYRYADLLEMDKGIIAEKLVGGYTELMPGRPTISEHRFPTDDVKRFTNYKKASSLTKLDINILTAAEQQTMNYYMNQAAFYQNKLGRQLYTEIGMIEEQHVTLYGGLKDTTSTWLEDLLMHEYTECYLYYSLWQDETDRYVKKVWEEHFNDELQHLHVAAELLQKHENKVWQQVIPNGDFPELLAFRSNIDYIRKVLKETVNYTARGEDYSEVGDLPAEAKFFDYQREVNGKDSDVASHNIIRKYIADNGKDYRFQTAEHPVEELRERNRDNTTVGR